MKTTRTNKTRLLYEGEDFCCLARCLAALVLLLQFRMYHARCNPEGGDGSDQQLKQTKSIAGIRAGFQVMMLDVFELAER